MGDQVQCAVRPSQLFPAEQIRRQIDLAHGSVFDLAQHLRLGAECYIIIALFQRYAHFFRCGKRVQRTAMPSACERFLRRTQYLFSGFTGHKDTHGLLRAKCFRPILPRKLPPMQKTAGGSHRLPFEKKLI